MRKKKQPFKNIMHFNIKGVSLIITIFAMMVFAVLGWSLAVMTSTDFESNARDLDSAQALAVAEAGANWALNQLSQSSGWRTAGVVHTITNVGQYNVVCRDAVQTEGGSVAIESSGYVPQQTNYRSLRTVKIVLSSSGFDKAATIRHLLDWSGMRDHSGSYINGDITVVDRAADSTDGYEGNHNAVHNETVDINVYKTDSSTRQTTSSDSGYPVLDLAYMRSEAGSNVWDPPGSNVATIKTVETVSGSGNKNKLRIEVNEANFFSGADNLWENIVEVRNKRGEASGLAVKWELRNWGYISDKIDNQKVELTFDSGLDMTSTGANCTTQNKWCVGQSVEIGRRFTGQYNNDKVWYAAGDAVFDARSGQVKGNMTSFVAEGDMAIIGNSSVDMKAHVKTSTHETFPNLATKHGNIYSTNTNNSFDGLIYSETGKVWFHDLDGVGIMGYDVQLDGLVHMTFKSKYVDSDGFVGGGTGSLSWQEQ